jgi:hypothetical protein
LGEDVNRKLSVLVLLALAVALILPSSALAYNWTRSPVNPLVKGGVHSTAKFKKLMTSNNKVRSAIKGVVKADKYPGWVFGAATKQAAAGNIHSTSLRRGAHIGAMGFGLKKTRIIKNTIWRGRGRLPYYYVNASNTVVQQGYNVTTTFKVCLSKTCANPFVIGRRVTRTPVRPPATLFNLYIDTRDGSEGPRMSGCRITGTVGATAIDVTTDGEGPVLLGQFAPGTLYNLTEVSLPPGYGTDDPGTGNYTGPMPSGELTLTFTNANT